jgi:hypothetical protein
MIYKFKSKVCGDVIMLGPQGDQLLRLLGREPAPRGIIEPPDMADAVARLKAAVQAAEQVGANEPAGLAASADSSAAKTSEDDAVSLRRRLWPMIEMLTQSGASAQPVVWGV